MKGEALCERAKSSSHPPYCTLCGKTSSAEVSETKIPVATCKLCVGVRWDSGAGGRTGRDPSLPYGKSKRRGSSTGHPTLPGVSPAAQVAQLTGGFTA